MTIFIISIVVHSNAAIARNLLAVVLVASTLSACSVNRIGTNIIADAISGTGSTYATDQDVELVGAATPFGLKLMESVLEQTPEHEGLLLAAARGFTQYAYVYVHEPADRLESTDPAAAQREFRRASNLYRRARDYALRALELRHPGFRQELKTSPRDAVAATTDKDVALLYWTAAAWGAAVSLSKDDPFMVADLGAVDAVIRRAYELDESFDHGAINTFLISYEMSRRAVNREAEALSRSHFTRAVELSNGMQAAPYVALAEAVAVANNDPDEFRGLLNAALAIDAGERPEWRLANVVMQRRARNLLARSDEFFLE